MASSSLFMMILMMHSIAPSLLEHDRQNQIVGQGFFQTEQQCLDALTLAEKTYTDKGRSQYRREHNIDAHLSICIEIKMQDDPPFVD